MKANLWLITLEDVERFGLLPEYHGPPVFLGQRAMEVRNDKSLFVQLDRRYSIEPTQIDGLPMAHDGISHYRIMVPEG